MTRSIETMRCTTGTVIALVLWLSLTARVEASNLAPGVYVTSGHKIYVGVQHGLPGPASNDFFDSTSQGTGDLQATHDLHLRSGIFEEPRVIEAPQGRLGLSLYYAGERPRATVILVHGNDPETREMGFIIRFFVWNGVNGIIYDQPEVGESAGDWFLIRPSQRAEDVESIYDVMRSDLHIDAHRIGIWVFSKGCSSSPLVSIHRRVGFMILNSEP